MAPNFSILRWFVALMFPLWSSCGDPEGDDNRFVPEGAHLLAACESDIEVAIAPVSAATTVGGRLQFSASVAGASDPTVLWSVQEGSRGGTISAQGLYTAPALPGTFHVIATSNEDTEVSAIASVVVSASSGGGPVLVPGVWSNITPPGAGLRCCTDYQGGNSYGVHFVEFDPRNPSTLYVGFDKLGLWKSTDGGATWRELGNKARQNLTGGTATPYLDSPIRLSVDPKNSNHLYATQGVRGPTLGFWVSNDGGETWTMPQGFASVAATTATRDVTMMAVNPTNFDHVLIASHSPWRGRSNGGILESKDGGNSWRVIFPVPTWSVGTLGISFLFDPASGQGNANTWLVGTDGNGFWRTSNAGSTWTKVSNDSMPHAGHQIYYASNGNLFAGATPYPLRSTDNGLTWTRLNTLPYFYYYSVYGDGSTLYTAMAYTGTNAGAPAPFWTSTSAGTSWQVQPGGQTFLDGPYQMRFDPTKRILYAGAWGAGALALKLP